MAACQRRRRAGAAENTRVRGDARGTATGVARKVMDEKIGVITSRRAHGLLSQSNTSSAGFRHPAGRAQSVLRLQGRQVQPVEQRLPGQRGACARRNSIEPSPAPSSSSVRGTSAVPRSARAG
jgi:hypothetical protein